MPSIPDFAAAVAFLDAHVNLETQSFGDPPGASSLSTQPTRVALAPRRLDPPSLDRMRRLLAYLGEPQLDVPVLHITGTNGKGSTARIATELLLAYGLSVGTYTSPHLQKVTERIAVHSRPIDDADFAAVLQVVARAEEAAGEPCSFFELVTAAAYWWFGDVAVQGAVVEVGMGGRWDATNTADGAVALVTNVELDHIEYLGDTRRAIADEKAGIVKPDALAVIGETESVIAGLLEQQSLRQGARAVWRRDRDFACEANRLAVGGRVVRLRTPGAVYDDVFVPLRGRHQGENAAAALAAVEAFAEAPLPDDVVRAGLAAVTNPGRMEVVGREPLVLLDGAHNPAGARAAAVTLDEEFAAVPGRILVVGLLQGRDPGEMLDALQASKARLVIACAPPSPRALPPTALATAAHARGIAVEMATSVAEAVDAATDLAAADELVLITGSLYLVGAARAVLVR